MSLEIVGAIYSLVKCRERGWLHAAAVQSTKCLWNNCLELEAFIRSNTDHDIYKLDNKVPETVMLEEISDIS